MISKRVWSQICKNINNNIDFVLYIKLDAIYQYRIVISRKGILSLLLKCAVKEQMVYVLLIAIFILYSI